MKTVLPSVLFCAFALPALLPAQAPSPPPSTQAPATGPAVPATGPAAPVRSPAAQAVLEAMDKNDPAAAFRAATQGHEKRDASCTYLLGQMYELGRGAPTIEPKQAFILYEEAAKAGVPEGMTATARCLENGIGTAINAPKAMFYWQMAAEAGDPPALGRMGQAELEGNYRPANEAAALPWLEKAAAAKDPLGLWLLSRCYDSGLAGLTPSIEKALGLCSQAAFAGQIDAMHRMGELYLAGRGLPKDPVAATGWFRLAADHGHPPSLTNLALCYLNGTGCLENERFALELAAAAAKAGHPRAQYLIGRIFDEGLGLRPDPVVGLAYHLRAMKNGIPEARTAVDRLKTALPPEDVLKAEKLAAQADWQVGDPKKR